MDQSEIAAFRTLLTALNEELTPKVARRDAPDAVHSAAASELLREVRTALTRIEYGSYGSCLNCDQDISASQCRALPWASLCSACQSPSNTQRLARPDLRGVQAA
jgi:RNA polymerase-binding transcription factor DksA